MYYFNPKSINYIWIMPHEADILSPNQKNELLKLLVANLEIKIIYDSNLSNAAAITNLKEFCDKNLIKYLDVKELFSLPKEQQLLNCYVQEAFYLKYKRNNIFENSNNNTKPLIHLLMWTHNAHSNSVVTYFQNSKLVAINNYHNTKIPYPIIHNYKQLTKKTSSNKKNHFFLYVAEKCNPELIKRMRIHITACYNNPLNELAEMIQLSSPNLYNIDPIIYRLAHYLFASIYHLNKISLPFIRTNLNKIFSEHLNFMKLNSYIIIDENFCAITNPEWLLKCYQNLFALPDNTSLQDIRTALNHIIPTMLDEFITGRVGINYALTKGMYNNKLFTSAKKLLNNSTNLNLTSTAKISTMQF